MKMAAWFKVNARRPLAIAAAIVFSLWGFLTVRSYFEMERGQRVAFSQMTEVTSLALTQKNRILIESLLQTAQIQLNALTIAVCKGPYVIMASRGALVNCHLRASIRQRVFDQSIPGFADHRLVMSLPRFAGNSAQLIMLVGSLGLVVLALVLLKRVQSKFETEVIEPLKVGISGEYPLDIAELEDLRRFHHDTQEVRTRAAVAEALVLSNHQIAHDIRSPLSALNMISSSLTDISDEKKTLIRSAIQRINDIANGLVAQANKRQSRQSRAERREHRGNGQLLSSSSKVVRKATAADRTAADRTAAGSPPADDPLTDNILADNALSDEAGTKDSSSSTAVMLGEVVDCVVSEKRLEFRNRAQVKIDADIDCSYGQFAAIDPADLARVLSNLVNNSVEAIESRGSVTIAIRDAGENLVIAIADTGKGMPEHVLARAGERNYSYGKTDGVSGSGLGLFHAKSTIERGGGTLRLQSREGQGTIVTLTVLKAKAPDWYLPELELKPGQVVMTVDDEPSLHAMWRVRLREEAPSVKHSAIYSLSEFEKWAQANLDQDNLVLLNHEFGPSGPGGLGVLESMPKIGLRVVLVTSRSGEASIQRRVVESGIKMIPKSMASAVPIRYRGSSAKHHKACAVSAPRLPQAAMASPRVG